MQFVVLLILIAVLLTLVFAAYGLLTAVQNLFEGKDSSSHHDARYASARIDADDVDATEKLLNYLLSQEKIDDETYRQFYETLKAEFPDHPKLQQPADSVAAQSLSQADFDSQVQQLRSTETPDDAATGTEATIIIDDVEVVSNRSAAAAVKDVANQPNLPPAPWELPDPPEPEPRRSFKEMMASFMQDKNIRWGELASGILIVGSAVGLVVSLRNELRDTIPYFSALLFLLITAAIHGAGIYTLKKWKLRNTSRGTLLIGLLLIPLNFLAACILSTEGTERRELTDPLLWTAIGVGLSSFGAMTWFSGKCLLRRGQLPLVLSIMGSAIGTLVINRAVGIDESSVRKMLLSLPLALSFVAGTVLLFRTQWTRKKWQRRAAFRVFIAIGIAAFAFLSAASLLLIRAGEKSDAVVALTPSLSLVAILASWLGHIIWKRASGTETKTISIAGLSLHIFGLVAAAAAWLTAFSNPTVLLVTSGVLAISMVLFAYQRQETRLLFAGWLALGSFVLCGINLLQDKLKWDVSVGLNELSNAALTGQSGISLLLLGAAVAGLHCAFRDKNHDGAKFFQAGLFSGGLLSAFGCLFAMLASFRNRDNVFDNMTATSLLGLATVAAFAGCYSFANNDRNANLDNKSDRRPFQFAHVFAFTTAALLLAFLAHGFSWNQTLSTWLNQTAFSINANWPLILTTHATVLAIASASIFGLRFRSATVTSVPATCIDSLANAAAWTGAIGLGSSLFLLEHQTGIATMIAAAITASALLFTSTQQNKNGAELRRWSITSFVLTAIVVAVAVIELLTRMDWCPGPSEPRHWLIQISALSVWIVASLLLVWLLSKFNSLRKLTNIGQDVTVFCGLILTFGFILLTATALAGEAWLELFQDANQSMVQLGQETGWCFAAAGLLMCALLAATFRHPAVPLGAAILVVWTMIWSLGSLFFVDAKAVATTMRWLIPVGGAIGAVIVAVRKPMVPVWATARNQVGLDGRSTWKKSSTQNLISLSLVLSSVIVLGLSTIAIVQVIMFGGVEALGGPLKGTLFGDMKKDISYGLPVGIIVNTFLLYAISERRKWLATAGSAVFQYCVVLSVVLLFISPHPKLASSWFVNILQAVSVGMTGYGVVWWYFRDRIGTPDALIEKGTTASRQTKFSQLEIHTSINSLLITSLAVLVISRFFRFPAQSGDWINSIGGPLGLAAWAFFGLLLVLVWRKQLQQAHRTSTWMWLSCWSGFVLVGMLAAFFDRTFATDHIANTYQPWLTFNLIMWGAITICATQVGLLFYTREQNSKSDAAQIAGYQPSTSWSLRNDQLLPLLFAGSIAFAFALRGMFYNSAELWTYLTATLCLVAIMTVAGFIRQSGLLGFISAGLTTVTTLFLIQVDPNNWFNGSLGSQPYTVNVLGLPLVCLALIWCGYYVFQTVVRKQQVRSRMVWMPNTVTVLAGAWCLLGSLAQWIIDTASMPASTSCMRNEWGIAFLFAAAILIYLQVWNGARKGLALAGISWWFAIIIFVVSAGIAKDGLRESCVLLGIGCGVACLGWFWIQRKRWLPWLATMQAPNLTKLEKSLYHQLPVSGTLFGMFVLAVGLGATFFADVRLERYLVAFSPFGLAIGFSCWSDATRRRWIQITSLLLFTVAMIFVSWADLYPTEIAKDATRLFVRMLLVLAGTMFFYGGVVARFVHKGDRWLKSLREISVVTCGMAIVCFGIVLMHEFQRFVPDVGCGMPLAEAVAVTVAIIGMGFGLLVLAVRPEHDPLALSLEGRMGYTYIAQLVATMLIVHLFFTMPFLFRIGIRHYWPYIAMVLCFAGVGIAHLLEKRKLTVLGQPLFNSAAILPVLVALLIWGIDSRADHSLVTLIVGLAYLMLSYTHRSILSGMAAILFGNLALWLFYDKFESFNFFDHPQLWLIPPAASVLVAAQISKARLNASQLALIRYLCVTTIYLSSTSEIFINGLGSKLWPPMVLALLSVAGILIGIMLQIRAYLYLGALFLLLAMVTMVSHAHQQLEHVWPWWAFGITLGIAILVMFGLFEKRKNDLQHVFDHLQQWEH